MNVSFRAIPSWLVVVSMSVMACMAIQGSAKAQTSPSFSSISRPVKAPPNEQLQKVELVLELAKTAAEAELFELSMEAVLRVIAVGPAPETPRIQSSLLGGRGAAGSMTARTTANQVPDVLTQFSKQIFEIIDLWRSKNAPVDRVFETCQAMVYRETGEDRLRLMVEDSTANESSTYYDFNFAKIDLKQPGSGDVDRVAVYRVLGLELVDLAIECNALPTLIEKLGKYHESPATKAAASVMLAYGLRAAGKKEEALKLVSELVSEPIPAQTAMPIYFALKRKIVGGGEDSEITAGEMRPLLGGILKQHFQRPDVRRALMQELRLTIELGELAGFDEYISLVSEAIEHTPNVPVQTAQIMLNNFRQSILRECRAQGRPELVVEIVSRLAAAQPSSNRSPLQGMTPFQMINGDELESLFEFPNETRLNLVRKLLQGKSLVNAIQFGYARGSRKQKIPAMFLTENVSDKDGVLAPYDGASTKSMLDLLLNQALAEGNEAEVAQELLAQSKESVDVQKLLAQWLILRAEKRGQTADPSLVKLGAFETERDYVIWWRSLPAPAAMELMIHRLEKGSMSLELLDAAEPLLAEYEWNAPFNEMRFQRKLVSDKSVVSIDRLKHWVLPCDLLTEENSATSSSCWTVNAEPRVEYLGGKPAGALLFRYPLPVSASIQVRSQWNETKSAGLYSGGIALMSPDHRGNFYAMSPSGKVGAVVGRSEIRESPIPLTATFNEQAVEFSVLDRGIKVVGYASGSLPFLGLTGYANQQADFADVKISAPAEIPREVVMLDTQLSGWNSRMFNHASPRGAAKLEVENEDLFTLSAKHKTEDSHPASDHSPTLSQVWRFVDSELRGGRVDGEADNKTDRKPAAEADGRNEAATSEEVSRRQSLLAYARPLCDGEKVEFEFFHRSDSNNAAPVIGRTAYLVRDGKIVLHWIASAEDVSRTGISVVNVANDPEAKMLATLKLNKNEWNRGSIRLENQTVVLSINGVDVYQGTLASEGPQQFGFFCDPSVDVVKVRHVILSGDWPKEVPADLFERW